jgi:DNA-binding NarL/FixJ family response regulator
MLRVFIACSDAFLFESLCKAFEGERDFEVCGDARDGVEAITRSIKLNPNLVILEMELPLRDGFEVAESLKQTMPEVPIFLVTERHNAQEEKEALSHGIAAVFEKDLDCKSIMMNARATCGFTERDVDPIVLR